MEDEFYKLVQFHDPNARRATQQEQFEHIDFVTSFGTIDVKGRKRGPAQIDEAETIVWLEYKNVVGNDGWLVSVVDILAFERDDDFILVGRKDLLRLANKLCNLEERVENSWDALYKGYTRRGRHDLVTKVKMRDIMELEHEIWNKGLVCEASCSSTT